ncbi:pyridoxal phosphate-dependent aminotransferase [Actinosynnema sp. NPDC004786]
MTAARYPMRQWAFEDTPGRYEIDLGNSYVPVRDLADLAVPAGLALGYGSDVGTSRLREAVAARYGEGADPDRVLVTHGAAEALYLLFTTLLRPGDRVLTFLPGWLPSVDVPVHLGCRVQTVARTDDMAVDLDAVRAAAGPDLRLVYLDSPGNPGGRRATDAQVTALADLVAATDGYLVLDEEYRLDLAGSPAGRHPRVVSVSGLAKVYGLPGLRIGWLHGPADVVAGCARHKHYTSIANSVLCEELAAGVLDRHEEFAAAYDAAVAPGLEVVAEWADRHADLIRVVRPEGTPFAWASPTSGEPSLALCRRALDVGVLLMPGETLGSDRGVRLGFARDPATVAEGLRRITPLLRP